ncbi:hypothetical protein [Methylobacterium sp. 1030]|uniref:hypothetical protein n=1 Tax=Methylobacterium sp. 1030 TaxID=3156404 RepID=UPI0033932496
MLPVLLNWGRERAGRTTFASFQREALQREAILADIDRTDTALRLLNTRFRRIDQRGG